MGLPAGLHLNLTEGVPISPPHVVQSLIDPLTGMFFGKFGFFAQLDRSAIRMEEVWWVL